MTAHGLWSWGALLMLGAFHGINPAMGWLFAVALGLQEHRRGAVYRAIVPLGLGHGLAIAVAILIAWAAGLMLPIRVVHWGVAGILFAIGVDRFIRHRHPRWVGMRVGMKDLATWSFLMASAHGASLMVLPIFLVSVPGHETRTQLACMPAHGVLAGLTMILAHSTGYLLTTALAALLVFERFGLGLLRKAWFNVDLIWALSLMATGFATLVA